MSLCTRTAHWYLLLCKPFYPHYAITIPAFHLKSFHKHPYASSLSLPITFALSIKDAITTLSNCSRCRYSFISNAPYFRWWSSSASPCASSSDAVADNSCVRTISTSVCSATSFRILTSLHGLSRCILPVEQYIKPSCRSFGWSISPQHEHTITEKFFFVDGFFFFHCTTSLIFTFTRSNSSCVTIP